MRCLGGFSSGRWMSCDAPRPDAAPTGSAELHPLGANRTLEHFSVARRVAFDPSRGRLWAVCDGCGRWNLAPLEERWDAIDECERRFRATSLRYSTGNVGLARLADDAELVRVGPALRPEVAAWRYGRILTRHRSLGLRLAGRAAGVATRAVHAFASRLNGAPVDDMAAVARLLVRHRGGKVLDLVRLAPARDGMDTPVAVVRCHRLNGAALVRPESGRPLALSLPHDTGTIVLEGDAAVRSAAKLLAAINSTGVAGGISRDLLETAVRKIDESALPDSYFNRVLALALRSDWGRGDTEHHGDARLHVEACEGATTDVERIALRLTGRAFWGHGGIGSRPQAALLDVPLVDRLALEMAAHEDTERRAFAGELSELERAWRDAEEIAAIADAMFPVPDPAHLLDRQRTSA